MQLLPPLPGLILRSLYHFLATCRYWETCLVRLGKSRKANSGIFVFSERCQALFQKHELHKHRREFQTMICLPLAKNRIDVHHTSQEDIKCSELLKPEYELQKNFELGATDKSLATFWSIWHCESAAYSINCWKPKVRTAFDDINKKTRGALTESDHLPTLHDRSTHLENEMMFLNYTLGKYPRYFQNSTGWTDF